MNRSILCVHFLVVVAVCATTVNVSRAELLIPQPTVDLGRIRCGQIIEQRFTIVNQGPGTAEIVEANASCGCLNPVIDRRVLQPGETGNVLLRVHTLSAPPGIHAWRVDLRYRSEGMVCETGCHVRAEVIQEIMVQPPALLVYANGPVQHELTVTDLRPRPFRINHVEATSHDLVARVAQEERNAAGHLVRRISLKVEPDLPPGRHDEQVVIHTNDPEYRELRIPVAVIKKARQRHSALPAGVSVVASASQPAPSRLVTIRSNDGQPVQIERVDTGDQAVTCQWAPGRNAVGTVKITVDRTKFAGQRLDSQVQVFFGAGDAEGFIIPVSCEVR